MSHLSYYVCLWCLCVGACVRIHVYMHIMYLEPVFIGFQAARKVPSDIGCGQETVEERGNQQTPADFVVSILKIAASTGLCNGSLCNVVLFPQYSISLKDFR